MHYGTAVTYWAGSALWDSSDILDGECIMGQQ